MSLALLRKMKLGRRKWRLALAGAGCLLASGACCLLALVAGPAVASVPGRGHDIPFGQSMTGDMTYYNNVGTDACGGQIDPVTQDLVAVSPVWWTTANPNDDPLCDGVSVRLTYHGHTLTLPVRDKCAACDATHIDVSQAVFQRLAPLSVGVLKPVTWQFVRSRGQPGPSPVGPSPASPSPASPSPASPSPAAENLAVSPSPSPSAAAAGAGGCAAAWSSSRPYSPGEVVSDKGDNWTSIWWSTGAEPGAPISWDVWADDRPC
jgi:hypothetical protein